MVDCEHCKLSERSCPIVNKAECPINILWQQAEEADKAKAELLAEAERIVGAS